MSYWILLYNFRGIFVHINEGLKCRNLYFCQVQSSIRGCWMILFWRDPEIWIANVRSLILIMPRNQSPYLIVLHRIELAFWINRWYGGHMKSQPQNYLMMCQVSLNSAVQFWEPIFKLLLTFYISIVGTSFYTNTTL